MNAQWVYHKSLRNLTGCDVSLNKFFHWMDNFYLLPSHLLLESKKLLDSYGENPFFHVLHLIAHDSEVGEIGMYTIWFHR
jgi:hypothetical protein